VPERERQGNGGLLTSKAAYARSQVNRLTIAVQLSRTSTSSNNSVRVSAQGGGILGSVAPDTIVFPAGKLLSDFKVFNLVGAAIGQANVGKQTITWDWSLTPEGGGTTQLQTSHEIYTLLSLPTCPWGQPGSTFPGFQVPWTDVLDWACTWASGATTLDEATARITREIHRLGQTKLEYDTRIGADPHFIINGHRTFKCTKFLNLLSSNTHIKALVNCTDCAIFVSSFTNILGGDLNQSIMVRNFNTNLILEIGLTTPHATNFRFHEVAWKVPSDANAGLFDSCLQVDAVEPTNNVFESPMLALGIPLGSPGTNYHRYLVRPGSNCFAVPRSSLRRKIDGRTVTRRNLAPELERPVKEEYDFGSWETIRTSDENIFLWQFSQNRDGILPSGWSPQDSDHFEDESGTTEVTETIWTTDKKDISLRELSYECDSLADAHSLLLTLLDEFQLPIIQRRFDFKIGDEQRGIGDVAFSAPDDLGLLFARANIVTFLQNEGPAFVSASQFARDLDVHIPSKPGSDSELIEMNRFRIAAEKVRIGDEIPIQFIGEQPADEALYKFFSSSGEIYRRKDQLFYWASVAGPNLITIFAFQTGQKTARQNLSFVAELATSDQKFSGFDTNNVNRRRNDMAFDFTRYWSSIRPVGYESNSLRSTDEAPPAQLDLTRNGVINIEYFNDETGEVRGYYTDTADAVHPQTVSLTGRITFIGHNKYAISLRHEEPPRSGNTIIYEGETVALDDGDRGFFIVSGRFRKIYANRDNIESDAQDEGVWVATKP
jgi:hypothetical protein